MPADRSDAACTVAGVRKPSMKEPAGNGRRWRRERRALWRFAHDGGAALDRRHHLQLAETDVTCIGLPPSRSMVAEDIRDLQGRTSHDRRAYDGGFFSDVSGVSRS